MSTSGTTTSALAIGGENGGYTGIVMKNGMELTGQKLTDLNTQREEKIIRRCWS